MKKIVLALALVSSLVACKNDDKKATTSEPATTDTLKLTKEGKEQAIADTANYTTIQWIDSTVNLGKLKKDNSVEVTFRFKNTGTKNLIIEEVTAQCGCTIPEKPQQAFAPGEEGIIKAKYNGSGSGAIMKQVYVTANTNPTKSHTLTFTGEVN